MWDAILNAFGMGGGQAAAGAAGSGIASGVGSLGVDAMAGIAPQSVVGTAGNLAGGMTNAAGMPIGQIAAANAASPLASAGGKLGNLGKLFSNENLGSMFKGGMEIKNYLDGREDAKHLKNMNNQNMAMAQGSYNANMADRDKTSNLNF